MQQAQEVAAGAHQRQNAAGDAHHRLTNRHIGGESLQILKRWQYALLLEQGLQEVSLGGEVIVDGGVGDPDLAGDVPDRRASETVLGEEA